ncbi:hypothetical protein [uncultured Thermomonospora sp.]|uniref:hypothetical protein n=1 Tax=uncultured Thermomonospora sp. TaxID=671175 RepID=UPI00259B2A4C|nr:hypothetical protein [uncultured Thermomonospora sp.]
MAKSSKSVTLSTVAVMSVAFAAGCGGGNTVTADCVVRQPDGRLAAVHESNCQAGGGGGGGKRRYEWVYGGKLSGGYVTGGSFVQPGDATVKTRSGRVISRGGFGGSGKSGGS